MNFVEWVLFSEPNNEKTFSYEFLDAWVRSASIPGVWLTDDFGLYIMGGEL